MDLQLFMGMLSIPSTSGEERKFGEWLYETLSSERKEFFEVGDGSINLLFSWGRPKIVFCTHIDTVPPYIPPKEEKGGVVFGRGSCDAKGQIFSMYTACKTLENSGCSDFALLLLSGEETGSFGAKAFAKTDFRAPYLIVGEPTDNCLVRASKGTASFDLHFEGEAFHSGYPDCGKSAVNMFVSFMNELNRVVFLEDPVLGKTTYNVGLLRSDNPQNILSPSLDCRIYFRTTFATEDKIGEILRECAEAGVTVTERGGDKALEYFTLPGFQTKTVSFGSDAPHLSNFEHKMICGPGSILTAHRDNEMVSVAELEEAVKIYTKIYESCN